MPIPLLIVVIFEILELVAVAATVDELLTLMEDLFEDYSKFTGGVEEAEKELRRIMRQIETEIAQGIERKEELIFLEAMTKEDPQNPATRLAQGPGVGAVVINQAIQQKIPFRRVISRVCDQANKLPIPSLRKKKGVTVKDLPTTKAKALAELLRLTVEELTKVELQELIVVRLRQLATSLIFEFIDRCLDWKSPMKAEVSFGPPQEYEDHPLAEGSATRLLRGGSKVNPFYPGPYFRRRNSLAADLVITEYRADRCGKSNIFAIVEIKFAGDRIDLEQFKDYRELLEASAKLKTSLSAVRHLGRSVSSGGRLSLFRYPTDKAADHKTEEKKPDGKTLDKSGEQPSPKHHEQGSRKRK